MSKASNAKRRCENAAKTIKSEKEGQSPEKNPIFRQNLKGFDLSKLEKHGIFERLFDGEQGQNPSSAQYDHTYAVPGQVACLT